MPSPMFNVAQITQSVQYTGTNSADIDTQVPNVTILSEADGVLVLDHLGSSITLNTGEWLLWSPFVTFAIPNSLYVSEWRCVTLCGEINTGVASIGMALVPTLNPTDSVVVPVTLRPAMPDVFYTAFASKFSSTSTSDLAINSVTVVDTDTVNVEVQNMGLATISGASIMVHAIE